MATDSLNSEIDKMDLQGKRNTTCTRAPYLRTKCSIVSSNLASLLLNLFNLVIVFLYPLPMHFFKVEIPIAHEDVSLWIGCRQFKSLLLFHEGNLAVDIGTCTVFFVWILENFWKCYSSIKCMSCYVQARS